MRKIGILLLAGLLPLPGCNPAKDTYAATLGPASIMPSMPARNPWLADGVFPISHFNPAATDSVPHAGPTRGRPLALPDITIVPNLYTSNATVKTEGNATIVIASGIDGIRKIDVTGELFDPVSFLPYPGFEALSGKSTSAALAAALADTNAAVREKDDAKILALSRRLADLGFSREHLANGVHSLIDKDGFHYTSFGGLKILKTTDDNDPRKPLRVVKVKDLSKELPPGAARDVTLLSGLGMTYEGDIVAAAPGALFLLDRELSPKGILPFPGEAVENGICTDETGIYVVTSRRMLKVVWKGSKLSFDEPDGGWQSPYNTKTAEQAAAAGALTTSGGSVTTPTLMGFGDDLDKLVIIADGDPGGPNLVAFWRDRIPAGFNQKPGTKSRRIADQARIDISKVSIGPSPDVLGNGVLVLDATCPKPVADAWSNAMAIGVTRPSPAGAEKLTWNARTRSFEKTWIRRDIDNADGVAPVVSAANGLVYFASRRDGRYEYLAVDWDTGELRARWPFPDDSRRWNVYGGGSVILEDGDLLLGGLFALKRVDVGDGVRPPADPTTGSRE